MHSLVFCNGTLDLNLLRNTGLIRSEHSAVTSEKILQGLQRPGNLMCNSEISQVYAKRRYRRLCPERTLHPLVATSLLPAAILSHAHQTLGSFLSCTLFEVHAVSFWVSGFRALNSSFPWGLYSLPNRKDAETGVVLSNLSFKKVTTGHREMWNLWYWHLGNTVTWGFYQHWEWKNTEYSL